MKTTKTILIAIILFGFISTVNAQVKFGFGIGYVVPSGDIQKITESGPAIHAELGYGINEHFDVSFYYQADPLELQKGNAPFSGNIYINSFLINGRYFFIKKGFKPYVSLGIGVATIDEPDIITPNENNLGSTKIKGETLANFGVRPSLGFKYGILNVNAAYLNAGKMGGFSTSDFSFNIGMLFTFGGNK